MNVGKAQSHAASVKETIVSHYYRYHDTLDESQEVIFCIFQGLRETRMFVSTISVSEEGLINFFGEDEEGNLRDIHMHYAHLNIQLEGVRSQKPHPMGFALGRDTRTN